MKPIFKLGVTVGAIGIITAAGLVARQRVREVQEAVSDQTTTNAAVGGSTEGLPAEIVAPGNETPVAAEATPTRLERVRYQAANQTEALAVNLVNDFEMAYNQHKGPSVRALFTAELVTDALPADLWEKERPFPVAFTLDDLAVRGDGSVLVTLNETVFNPLTKKTGARRRLLELFPADPGKYVIGRYFTPDNEGPLAGFEK